MEQLQLQRLLVWAVISLQDEVQELRRVIALHLRGPAVVSHFPNPNHPTSGLRPTHPLHRYTCSFPVEINVFIVQHTGVWCIIVWHVRSCTGLVPWSVIGCCQEGIHTHCVLPCLHRFQGGTMHHFTRGRQLVG